MVELPSWNFVSCEIVVFDLSDVSGIDLGIRRCAIIDSGR
jgi:hypothetical protein